MNPDPNAEKTWVTEYHSLNHKIEQNINILE